jgi:two-component system chemotaxis response regulator CheY
MPKSILIVDDSRTIRQQVSLQLQDAGYEVIEAVDAKDAIAALGKYPEVALMICDVNMPGRTGIELVELIRKQPRFAELPIVMLTSERHTTLVARAKEAGVKGWLVKPFNPNTLMAAARKLAGEPK